MCYFINWKRLRTPIPIVLGNQSTTQAICIGTSRLKLHSGHALKLDNVLYAPGLGCNLLSVGKLTSSSSYHMTFRNGTCHLIDQSGISVSSCNRIDGMYKLHCHVDKKTFALKATSGATSRTASKASSAALPLDVWHRRLGHLNERSVKLLASGLASDIAISRIPTSTTAICPPCLAGKQKEHINRTPQIRASKPLELIHSDMGGPLPISVGGSRYFIIFIDDFSRMTWISFMPAKYAWARDVSRRDQAMSRDVSCPRRKARDISRLEPQGPEVSRDLKSLEIKIQVSRHFCFLLSS